MRNIINFEGGSDRLVNVDEVFRQIGSVSKVYEKKRAEKLGKGISPIIAQILEKGENKSNEIITIGKIEQIVSTYNIPKHFVIILFLSNGRIKGNELLNLNLNFEDYYMIYVNYYGDINNNLNGVLLDEIQRLACNSCEYLKLLRLPYKNNVKEKYRDLFVREVNDIEEAMNALGVMFMNIHNNYEQFGNTILEKMNNLIVWIIGHIDNLNPSKKFSYVCRLIRYFRNHNLRTDYILYITEYLCNGLNSNYINANENKIKGFEQIYGTTFSKIFKILPETHYDIINFVNQIVYIDNDTQIKGGSDYGKVKISEFIFLGKKAKEIFGKLINKLNIDDSIEGLILMANMCQIIDDKNNFSKYYLELLNKIETEDNFPKFIKDTQSLAGNWFPSYDNTPFINKNETINPNHTKLLATLNKLAEKNNNFPQWEYLFRHAYNHSLKLLYFLKMLNLIHNNKENIERFRVYVYRMKDILSSKGIDTNRFENVYSGIDVNKIKKEIQTSGCIDKALKEELSITLLINARNIEDLFYIYINSQDNKLKELAFIQASKVLNILE